MAMRFPAKSNLELHLDFQYLLIELFYIGMPLVRTVGSTVRTVVRSHDYQNFSDGYITKGKKLHTRYGLR